MSLVNNTVYVPNYSENVTILDKKKINETKVWDLPLYLTHFLGMRNIEAVASAHKRANKE